MDFDKLDWSKYQIRFNQKIYNQLSIMKDNKIKYVITFHFIGMIDMKNNKFFWANIIPGVNLNFSKKNNKIKALKNKYENFKKDNQIYYQILSEDIVHIDDKINPDFIRKFFTQLLDKSILVLNSSDNKYQLVSVENINESY
jgi:hypothetical protein